jgi:hypothetical protein
MTSRSKTSRICGFAHNSDKIKVGIEKYPSPKKEIEMKDHFNNSERGGVPETAAAHPKRIVTVDVEKYQAYLDGSGMTDAEKKAYLEALWSLIVSFVDLGFGVHPLQEVCGKPETPCGEGAKEAFDGVSSETSNTDEKDNGFKP